MQHNIRIKEQVLTKKRTFSLLKDPIRTVQEHTLIIFVVKGNYSIQYS